MDGMSWIRNLSDMFGDWLEIAVEAGRICVLAGDCRARYQRAFSTAAFGRPDGVAVGTGVIAVGRSLGTRQFIEPRESCEVRRDTVGGHTVGDTADAALPICRAACCSGKRTKANRREVADCCTNCG